MWRSFLIALGIFLIQLGAQSLVVDQFWMSNHQRIPRFITSKDGIFASTPGGPGAQQSPKTFDSGFGKGSRYDLASYSQNSNNTPQFPAARNSVPIKVKQASANPSQKVITTKDWMPWSLLAAGTLLVIYTRASVGVSGDS